MRTFSLWFLFLSFSFFFLTHYHFASLQFAFFFLLLFYLRSSTSFLRLSKAQKKLPISLQLIESTKNPIDATATISARHEKASQPDGTIIVSPRPPPSLLHTKFKVQYEHHIRKSEQKKCILSSISFLSSALLALFILFVITKNLCIFSTLSSFLSFFLFLWLDNICQHFPLLFMMYRALFYIGSYE